MENNTQPTPRHVIAEQQLQERLLVDYSRRRRTIEVRHFAVLAALVAVAALVIAVSLKGAETSRPYGQCDNANMIINNILSTF